MKKIVVILALVFTIISHSQSQYQRTYSTYFGGNEFNNSYSTNTAEYNCVDSEGNIYLLGTVTNNENSLTYYTAFTTANAYQANVNYNNGNVYNHGLICKFSPQGILIWSSYFSCDTNIRILKLALDNQNNIYISAMVRYNAVNVPFITETPNFVFQYANNGTDAAYRPFLLKFTNAGLLLWGKYTKGNIYDIEFDLLNNMYVSGFTLYDTGVATVGAFQETFIGNLANSSGEPYLEKYSADGTKIWGTYYGNVPVSSGFSYAKICLDEFNNVYIASWGENSANNYYATSGCFQSATNFPNNAKSSFLSKFTTTGSRLWSTYVGLSSNGSGSTAIKNLNYQDNSVYVVGDTSVTTNVATPSTHQQFINSTTFGGDVFVMKFDSNGNRIWGTYYGGEMRESSFSSRCYGGKIYVSGITYSTTSIASADAYQSALTVTNPANTSYPEQNKDGFVLILNDDGTRYWSTYYGGDGYYEIAEILPFNTNTFYLAGFTQSNGMATDGSYQPIKGTGTAANAADVSNLILARFDINPLAITTNNVTSLQIAPNPNNGNFTITGSVKNIQDQLTLNVVDLQGRTVFTKNVAISLEINETIQLEGILCKGIYLVSLKNENQVLNTYKIIMR